MPFCVFFSYVFCSFWERLVSTEFHVQKLNEVRVNTYVTLVQESFYIVPKAFKHQS